MFSVLEGADAFEARTVARPEAAPTVAADAVTNFLRDSTALCSIPARADQCREQRAPTPPETFPEPVRKGVSMLNRARSTGDFPRRPVAGACGHSYGPRLTRR